MFWGGLRHVGTVIGMEIFEGLAPIFFWAIWLLVMVLTIIIWPFIWLMERFRRN